MAIPRYRSNSGPAILAAGFRPFFLLAALWAALAVPLWLALYSGELSPRGTLPPAAWHAHEMIFGYAAAVIAGFLLTAIPNWTGRMPLQGAPLAGLVLLWLLGRGALLFASAIGAPATALLDLAFPATFLAVIAREILAGRNWRNLPMLAALALLLAGNLLVHLEPLGIADIAGLGNRLGLATILMLISLVGGRIIPSFTRNWLAREQPEAAAPALFGRVDRAALAATGVALASWAIAPEGPVTPWLLLTAGLAQSARLLRWRGARTIGEPLVAVLHLGYGWLGLGFLLLAIARWLPLLPPSSALHALTVGAVGTMTLAVMTRASLGHTGRPLAAGKGTVAIYGLVTLAAILRLAAPLAGAQYLLLLSLSGAAWSGAFGLFVLLYLRPLTLPRLQGPQARPV